MSVRMGSSSSRGRALDSMLQAVWVLCLVLSTPVAAQSECTTLSAEAFRLLPTPTDVIAYARGDLFQQMDSKTNRGAAARAEQLKKTLRLDDKVLAFFNEINIIDVVAAHKEDTGQQLIVVAVAQVAHDAFTFLDSTNDNLKFELKGKCGYATYSRHKELLDQVAQGSLSARITDLVEMGRKSDSPFWAVAAVSKRSHERIRKAVSDPKLANQDIVQKLEAVAGFARIRPDSTTDVSARFAYPSEKDAATHATRIYGEIPGKKTSSTVNGRYVTIGLSEFEFAQLDAFLDRMR